jgi:hypothetical protein
MTMTLSNYKIGAAQVLWNSVDLGATKGGVEISIEQMQTEIKADQFGETIVDEVVVGKKAIVKTPLYQTDLAQLAKVFSGFTVDGTTNKRVDFDLDIGDALLGQAQALVVKRMSNETTPATSEHEWYYFYKAVPVGPLTEKYSWDGQAVYEVEWHIFPDSANSYALGRRGYETTT